MLQFSRFSGCGWMFQIHADNRWWQFDSTDIHTKLLTRLE
jgi:hypothetical protein